MLYCQPQKIVLAGERQAGGGGNAINRQNVFKKDCLYLNIQSDAGCTLTVNLNFKTEFTNMRSSGLGGAKQGAFGQTGMQGMTPRLNTTQGTTQKIVETPLEEFDFTKWNLGSGKIQEKRVKLEMFMKQLMDRTNWKFKKDHDIHVSKWLSIIIEQAALKQLLLFLTVFANLFFREYKVQA